MSVQPARGLVLLLVLSASACSPQELPPAAPPMAMRHLIMMTDGVPWEVMDSLHRAGRFQAFNAPSQLVSPFPSLTGVAFRDIWQEELSPGYEDKYYDTKQNRMTGGLLDHIFKPAEHLGFHRKVEVEANALTTGLAYVTPVPMSQLELKAVRSRIAERSKYDTTVVAYIVTTDAIAHRASRQELVNYLLQIDTMLTALRRENPSLRITLFSDHGNDFVTTRRVQLEDAVRRGGFRQVNKITGPNDVVLPKFGLVGSAFLYSSPHAEPRLAQALRLLNGVELVMFEDSLNRIHVWSQEGEAIVESDSSRAWYRYTAVTGDPLMLQPALTRLQATGQADASGAASDSAWLAASLRTPYIDALRRITIGMRSSVANPASVVVSFAPGYHFGDVAAGRLVTVRGTHGSLRTTSSLAYFRSTSAKPPALLRSDRVLPYVAGGF
jgi:hypothetical protein